MMINLTRLSRSSTPVVVLAVTAFTLCSPASSEAVCSAVGARSANIAASPARANAPHATVNGGGRARLTDAHGYDYPHQFSIAAVVNDDGTARGHATFVFPQQFARAWGAVPGADLVHVQGEITAGTVDANGRVTITGPFIETDFARNEGVVFYEDSRVTGVRPLIIEVSPGSDTFTFTWCELVDFNLGQLFSVEVTHGNLRVR